ncbi:MAG: RnfABCDGE type electron transport complex subunit D [Flavobacteriales bacterium]|nr:RnfABCDGE type electron transport complex subunit D [Flavobacteriales bacterium]
MQLKLITQNVFRLLKGLTDPRYFQILFLSSFLAFGVFSLGWSVQLQNYLLIITTCLTVQALAIYYLDLPLHSLRSALITSLGLCLLFKAGEPAYFILAGLLAIGSKFVLRFRNKHIFNPANFGVVAPILLTGNTWISPGQWGSTPLLLFFFGGAGLMILFRISRLETGLTFLITYAILWFSRDVIYLGWEPTVTLHKLTNGSLLLFSFFMITDPMTIPNNKKVRIIWSACIAILTFWVVSTQYIQSAALWILFLGAPIVPLLDLLFPAKKYQWSVPENTSNSISENLKTQLA